MAMGMGMVTAMGMVMGGTGLFIRADSELD